MTLRVLVVDDEPLARDHIIDRLAHEEDVEVVGTADNGDDAIAEIRRLHPDLVFLDVQMPGISGMDVAETLGDEMPRTIFCTAFDQYAIKAFDVAAIDYLLKPFDDERFHEAFRRARNAIPKKSPWLQRIPVEMRGQMRVVPVEKIDYITASGPYAELHAGERTFAVRERMQQLEDKLDPDVFMRVHRSVIVRLELIESLERGAGGDGELKLRGGARLRVSRTRREALERWLGLAR